MNNDDPLSEATKRLRRAVDDPGDVDEMPAGRDEAIRGIAEALRQRARANRRRRFVRLPLLAAAVVLLIGGGAFAVHRTQRTNAAGSAAENGNLGRLVDPSGVTAVRDGHSESLGRSDRLPEGTELRTTAAAEASLDFDTGTHVTIGGGSRVRLVEQSATKRFALESGALAARVAKLGTAERFVVTTRDAEVEVRGTAFRVSIVAGDPSCESGTPTRLDVSEGVVVVRHGGTEQRVGAGEHWPACAETVAVAGATASTTTVAPEPAPSSEPRVVKRPIAAPSASTSAANASSRLAEQNDLFGEAVRLERAGNAPAAIAKLDRLLADYPGGPLDESAAAKRMRLLAATDPPRAQAAARDYSKRHPRGFARAEAEAIAGSAP